MKINMKKSKVLIIFIILILIFMNISYVYAASCSICKGKGKMPNGTKCYSCGGTGEKTSGKTSGMIDTGKFEPGELEEGDYKAAFDKTSKVVSTITILGTVVAVVMVVVLGVKYMCGSVEEKAEYKKTMLPMLVGAILIFGSSALVAIIYSIVDGL